MASEASAVIVVVRVRPFTSKEDPLSCTVTVPNRSTINVVDVAAVLGSNSNSNNHSSSNNSGGKESMATVTSLAAVSAYGDSTTAAARHAFAFDQVFWSIAPQALPLRHPLMGSAASATVLAASFVLHGGAGGGEEEEDLRSHVPSRKESVLSMASTGGLSSSLSSSRVAVAGLPYFQHPPAYDDQASVYAYIGPKLCEAVMSGFNACLLAYGQTGSGKSYSMIGESLSADVALRKKGHAESSASLGTELGVMPRLSTDLFARMQQEREKDESVSYTVEVSFLEIYCEKVRDLLALYAPNSGAGAGASTAGIPGAGTSLPTAGVGGGGGGLNSTTSGSYINTNSSAGLLRIRQHPSRGPYVEGLSHVRVRDAEGVMKYLINGLRDRATAETKMNEHSSRSHAILQLHITKVTVVSDEGGVLTRTRTCKVNLVDLAGSERVTQSGVTGERFEEAKNINLSLSTLGRVIQQLSDKQAGKRVIPAYRESVLTWLLSDSLGGNSKTIMLATVAPSAYCYGQTLNTLRFAGVAKKIVNVATVNEDRQYQQVIAELRQQIVRLALQLERGKASEVHSAEIETLKAQKEELLAENNVLRSREAGVVDPSTALGMRKRITELEEANSQLRGEKVGLQQRMLQATSALREELAASRAEVLHLHSSFAKKEAEASDWQSRYRNATQPSVGSVSPTVIVGSRTATATGAPVFAAGGGGGGGAAFDGSVTPSGKASNAVTGVSVASAIETRLRDQSTLIAQPGGGDAIAAQAAAQQQQQRQQLQEEIAKLKKQVSTLKADARTVTRAKDESRDTARTAQRELNDYRVKYETSERQLDVMQERVESTTALLESTQFELARARQSAVPVAANAQRNAEEAVALAAQLAQTRQDYLKEKQGNVQLLMRVSQLEQERGQFKNQASERRADINELELLLLEETETSERYYLRMRLHRTLGEVHKNFFHKLSFALGRHGGDRTAFSSRCGSLALSGMATPSNYDPSNATHVFPASMATPRPVRDGDARSTSPSIVEQLLSQSAMATQNSWELMYAQLEYECLSDEAHHRAAIEQDYLTGTVRLLAQKSRLRQAQINSLSEQLVEAREQLHMTVDSLSFYRDKAAEVDVKLQEEQEKHIAHQEQARAAEMERAQLERQLTAAEHKAAEFEATVNTLIEKLADTQTAHDTLQDRCQEMGKMLNDAQDSMLTWQRHHRSGGGGGNASSAATTPTATPHGEHSNSSGSDASGENTNNNDDNDGTAKKRRGHKYRDPALFDAKAVMQLKEKELFAALQDAKRLEVQCESYRAELGAANAQREREASEANSRHTQLQHEIHYLHEKLNSLQISNAEAKHDTGAVLRDYEQRVEQQQAIITTLRHSLEEESRTADSCRTEAQQADTKLRSLQQDVNIAHDRCQKLEQQHHLLQGKYAIVQKELEDLRAHYGAMEQQLMELRKNEPELYVMLERGFSEDAAAWLEKVRQEKANLQKQKQDARQLNSELLSHIRSRNSHLRDVQRQLTEIAESSVNTSAATPADGARRRRNVDVGDADRRIFDSELVDLTDMASEVSSLPSSIHSISPSSAKPE